MKNFLSFFLSWLFLIPSVLHSQNHHYISLGTNDRIRNYHIRIPDEIHFPDCINDDYVYEGASILKSLEDFTIDASGVKVTSFDINKFGDEAFKEIVKSGKYRFIKSGKQLSDLKFLLSELLSVRKKSSGIKYQVHLIDAPMINALTVGGHIIITTGIIKEAGTLSAVAAILGHEIGHNEKGHITSIIKKIKIAKQMGSEDAGKIALLLQRLITPAFNQPNEIEADFYGVDLAYAAGFNPMASLTLWKKMSKKEHKNVLGSFMRSHPYSINRYNCIKAYINLNYKNQ